MMTAILITVAKGSLSSYQLIQMVVLQIGGGIACGVLFAAASVYLMKHCRFSTDGFDIIFSVGVALLAYAMPTAMGANGYLSVYIVGIVLGNSDIKNKSNLVHFFDGMTGLTQILIFFLMGLLAFPSRLPQVVLPALVIALIVTFIARPLSVILVLTPFRAKAAQQILVCWSGLRGAASIVFAMMATQSLDLENDIYHIVFTVVLFSILFQGHCFRQLQENWI